MVYVYNVGRTVDAHLTEHLPHVTFKTFRLRMVDAEPAENEGHYCEERDYEDVESVV